MNVVCLSRIGYWLSSLLLHMVLFVYYFYLFVFCCAVFMEIKLNIELNEHLTTRLRRNCLVTWILMGADHFDIACIPHILSYIDNCQINLLLLSLAYNHNTSQGPKGRC